MLNVLITGGDGQLANNFKDIAVNLHQLNLIYKNSEHLDISDIESLNAIYRDKKIDYCINCAAFTAVDKAESDEETAFKVNAIGVKNLSIVSAENKSVLIHISTDFVFDGTQSYAYSETDPTNPQGVYGVTKLKGEQAVLKNCNQHFIIRTSWLYSEHNANFMKTMLNLAKTKNELSVVDDQIGSPTYAKDLALMILTLINSRNSNYGIYNYSNEGVASWYDFAKAIFEESELELKLLPIKTTEYPTPAKRPHFSVLDKTKIKKILKIEIPHWRDSLKKAIVNLNNNSK